VKCESQLVTRLKSNAVACERPPEPQANTTRKRGQPRKYGKKIRIASLFDNEAAFRQEKSPIYGERHVTIRFQAIDLMWRPVGILVRFVIVRHPSRGSIMLLCSDVNLAPLDIIKIYGLRFKIELSFKQALRVIGTFAYHFWMAAMTPISRKSGDQYLHMKTKDQAAPGEAEAASSSVSLLPLCAPESNSGRLTIPMSITSRF
jgi:hypothetical protein